MSTTADSIFILYSYVAFPLSLMPIGLLFVLIITRTPRRNRDFAWLLASQQFTSLLIAFSQVFLMYRTIPAGAGVIYYVLGPANYFSRTLASNVFALQLSSVCCFIFGTINPFIHRYFLILGKTIKVKTVMIGCFCSRIPFILQYFALFTCDDTPELVSLLNKEYNYSTKNVILLGVQDSAGSLKGIYVLFIVQANPIFLLVAMLFIRYKTDKLLTLSLASERTKKMHRTLIRAFTVQFSLVFMMTIVAGQFVLGHYYIFRYWLMEYTTMGPVPFFQIADPIVSMMYISYYKIAILDKFGKKRQSLVSVNHISFVTQTSMIKHHP